MHSKFLLYILSTDLIGFKMHDCCLFSLTPMPSSASVRNFNIILKLALSVKLKEQFFQFLIGLYTVDFFA